MQSILDGDRVAFDERETTVAATAAALAQSDASPCQALYRVQADLTDMDERLGLAVLIIDGLRDKVSPTEAARLKVLADGLSNSTSDLALTRGRAMYGHTALCEWNKPAS